MINLLKEYNKINRENKIDLIEKYTGKPHIMSAMESAIRNTVMDSLLGQPSNVETHIRIEQMINNIIDGYTRIDDNLPPFQARSVLNKTTGHLDIEFYRNENSNSGFINRALWVEPRRDMDFFFIE